MLDLPPRSAAPLPPHWRHAPMPDAALCQAWPDRLLREGHPLAASPALLAQLAAPGQAGATIAAWDSSGTAWRLRRAAVDAVQPLWRIQSIDDSRERLLVALRGLLGRRLTGSVLHELRGPLNALSLHRDLIERVLAGGDLAASAPRLQGSAGVIRERLRDLAQRQDAAVALWLGEPVPGGVELKRLVEDSLRLLRGHLSLQEVLLRSEGLDALAGVHLARGAVEAQLVLIALLLAACAGALRNRVGGGEAELRCVAALEQGRWSLELQAPCEATELGRELADTDGEGLLAALALLLEPSGLRLEAQPELALTRLSPPG